jgi:hypothetical protein
MNTGQEIKLQYFSHKLKAMCHHPTCNDIHGCPKEHPPRCYEHLGLHTSIAWEAAWTVERLLVLLRNEPPFKEKMRKEETEALLLLLNALQHVVQRHDASYPQLADLLSETATLGWALSRERRLIR